MTLNWGKIKNRNYTYNDLYRAKVFGGWLVAVSSGGVTFLPDPDHQWDGNSLT